MKLRTSYVLLFILTILVSQPNTRAENMSNTIDIKDHMSASQFQAAGLEKLSEKELSNLNEWLNQFKDGLLKAKSKFAENKTPDVIESQIDGDFEGWEGETIFKLMNGQIWQQTSFSYYYTFAFMPEVLIYKTSGGYVMKVDDVEDTISVKRIK